MSDPVKIQSFINTKFKEIEIVATKREQVRRIIGILSSLGPDELAIISDFINFDRSLYQGQQQEQQEIQQPAPTSPGFQRTSHFMGHRPGYVFYNGPMGLGYYIDQELLPNF